MRIRPRTTRAAQILAAGVAVAILLPLYLYGVQRNRELHHNWYWFYPDVIRIQAVDEAARSIYRQSGRLIRSLAELEQTDYYPFPHQPYARSFFGGAIDVTLKEPTATECRYEGAVLIGSQIKVALPNYLERVGPRRETQRMVMAYSAGVARRTAAIHAIENQFISRHFEAADEYTHLMHHTPDVTFEVRSERPRPIPGDLPKDDRELKSYVAWLRATEGVTELKDAWGHPLKFTLTHKVLSCRSSGADGVAGTADDVVGSSQHVR